MMPGFGFGCFGNYGGYGWIGMIINLVIMLVVVIGIIWLVIWLVRRSEARGNAINAIETSLSPREILQARYARSEITREQYLEMLGDLS